MPDRFEQHAQGLESPATHGFMITPHDSDALPELTRALYVGGAGSLVVRLHSGAEITLAAVPAGTILPLRIDLIKATGTTASALAGLL